MGGGGPNLGYNREHEDIEFENDKSKEDKMSPLKDCNDVGYSIDGEALMIWISLNIQIKKNNVD